MAANYINALVTGASSGIGRAFAVRLSRAGISNLYICGRDAARLAEAKEECLRAGAGQVCAQTLDVRDSQAVKEWIFFADETSRLDLVFANAGVATGPENVSDNVRRTFDINFGGVVNTVLPAIERFAARERRDGAVRGQIAITSSMAGYHGLGSCPAYSGSKAGVKAWGAGLRVMLAPEGIRVNVICPGFVRSAITDANTCPMPFFMEADRAADIIFRGLSANTGLISFPWQMRLAAWLAACMPDALSEFIYTHLPRKNDKSGFFGQS